MTLLIRNGNIAIRLALTALKIAGFWADDLKHRDMILYKCYGVFMFMFLLGIYLLIQVVDLCVIWGNLPQMTGVAFLLFTNLAQATKIFNLVWRREQIQAIITECDDVLESETSVPGQEIVNSCKRETSLLMLLYCSLTFVTTVGWASSAEENKLPLQAWYPYDTSKSPAFEITYVHQVSALCTAAFLNVCKDTLVATLIAQCRCRLRLLGSALRNLSEDLNEEEALIGVRPKHKYLLTRAEENIVKNRLRRCVEEHQRVLETSVQLQHCFSEPTFLQFMVSLIIICVTAFQVLSQTGNLVRFFSMGTYLLNMMFQVFLYCYQGNQLTEESTQVAGAAYEFQWYACSVETRRSVLILMTRCRRIAKITAGGFTTLSLASFMAIIKASYSLFTLLQQVEERR